MRWQGKLLKNVKFQLLSKASRIWLPKRSALLNMDMTLLQDAWKKEEAHEIKNFQDGKSKEQLLEVLQNGDRNKSKLLDRQFKQILKESEKDCKGISVRVMQWNILAQALCTGKDNFVRCPTEALAWETRRVKVLEEILTARPNILCLQEVDHFGYFKPALESVGYKGHFFPKPDSPALYCEDSNGPDGCALFYDTESLHLVNIDSIVLQNLRGLETNQVSIIGTFTSKEEGKKDTQFCVATTHLKAKRGWHTLRQQQGQYLLNYLGKNYQGLPLVVAGDFNAEQTEGVYDAMMQSDLNLASAYTQLDGTDCEPKYTTWKIRGGRGPPTEICRTIDYIWYSKDKVQVLALLDLPSEGDIGGGRLPSFRYPSDHLSLVADLVICNSV